MARGCEPYAIREGYEGLVQGGKLIEKISWEDVRGHLSEVYPVFNCPWLMNRVERSSGPPDALHSENDLVDFSLLNISLKLGLMH